MSLDRVASPATASSAPAAARVAAALQVCSWQARPPGSRTHEQAVDADALALAVFAAHAAVRQHILCAAERRLTVTPFGAC